MERKNLLVLMPTTCDAFAVGDPVTGETMPDLIDLNYASIRRLAAITRNVVMADCYQSLASRNLLKENEKEGILFADASDGIPLVICQDPPTIVVYRNGTNGVCFLDAENYGLNLQCGLELQQLKSFAFLFGTPIWMLTAATTASQYASLHRLYSNEPQRYHELPEGSLIHKAHMGGRCGASRYGPVAGNCFKLYDLSGAYLCAATDRLPVTLLECGNGQPRDDDYWNMIADVTVRTDFPRYPYKPSADLECGRQLTIYPAGTFRTILCGRELECAARYGEIVQWHAYEHWQTAAFMANYSHRFSNLIAACDAGVRSAVKTVSLAGIGYHARKQRKWEVVDVDPPHSCFVGDFFRSDEEGLKRYRRVAGITMREAAGSYHDNSSPHVWAWIAASVRTRLADVIQYLGRRAFYWDTDSVITDAVGARLMEARHDFNKRGGWQMRASANNLTIWGYRRYVLGDLISIGIAHGAMEVAGGKYLWESPETWDEAMTVRRYPDGRMVERSARVRGTYDHGIVNEDGSISPYMIG